VGGVVQPLARTKKQNSLPPVFHTCCNMYRGLIGAAATAGMMLVGNDLDLVAL
jgi:hypothetical protein